MGQNFCFPQQVSNIVSLAAGMYHDFALQSVGSRGTVTVMDATSDTPRILAQDKLEEEIMATPALIGQTILFRTTTNLFAFGLSE